MIVTWSFKGENAREKLSPFEKEHGLGYKSQRKEKHLYEMELESYSQYQRLEGLSQQLGLELRIESNPEWLAVLFTNSTLEKEETAE